MSGETVVRIRATPGGFNAYGDPVASTTTRTDVPNTAVAPRMSTEPTTRGRNGSVIGLTIAPPAGSDIRSTDQVEVRGVVYDVEGDSIEIVSPFTGWAPGAEIALKRAVG
jgi:hypothetical protein